MKLEETINHLRQLQSITSRLKATADSLGAKKAAKRLGKAHKDLTKEIDSRRENVKWIL